MQFNINVVFLDIFFYIRFRKFISVKIQAWLQDFKVPLMLLKQRSKQVCIFQEVLKWPM